MACPSHMVVKEAHFIRFSSDRIYPQTWGTRPTGEYERMADARRRQPNQLKYTFSSLRANNPIFDD